MIELKNISKSYDQVKANEDLTFKLELNKVHVLAGQNGAGKSTLMKILFGLEQPDNGQILVDGKHVKISSPREAITYKIAMVQQHFQLVPNLTVFENVVLGTNIKANWYFNKQDSLKVVQKKSDELGLDIDCNKIAGTLSADIQQKVEILKALYKDAKYLILDEPTSLLGPKQIDNLLEFIKSFRDLGGSVALITHKLPEVIKVADDVSVIRNGKNVCRLEKGQFDEKMLAREMVGKDIQLYGSQSKKENLSKNKNIIFKMKDISIRQATSKIMAIDNISFEVPKQQIIGVGGVEGNGQRELIQFIFGQYKNESGQMFYNDDDITSSNTHQRRKAGFSFIPEDRHLQGLLMDLDICNNFYLNNLVNDYSNLNFINWKKLYEDVKTVINNYNVMPNNPQNVVSRLSGGNQQKVVLSRETSINPEFLVVSNPTWGLDVEAAEFVHERLVELNQQGTTIMLFSSDLNELLKLSNRLLIFYRGAITYDESLERADLSDISNAMAGL